ncbi:hypothetical protein ACP70R_028386 [Stipagrostis hirtigluma subsp. patula]
MHECSVEEFNTALGTDPEEIARLEDLMRQGKGVFFGGSYQKPRNVGVKTSTDCNLMETSEDRCDWVLGRGLHK